MTGVSSSVRFVRTGLHKFDKMTGGGIPLGRIMEIYGDPGVGKTTLAFWFMRIMQKYGHVMYLDFEESLDDKYMYSCGVEAKKLKILEPEYGEAGLDAALKVLDNELKAKATGKRGRHYSLIVIDSVAEATPKAEMEAESLEKVGVGLSARLMSRFSRVVGGRLRKTDCSIIGINQARDVIGNPKARPVSGGGRAWKHKCAVRIHCTGGKSKYFEGGARLGLWQVKNKVSDTITDHAEYHIERGSGINIDRELIEIAEEMGILEKLGGGWYGIGKRKFNGRLEAADVLRSSPVFAKFIETSYL